MGGRREVRQMWIVKVWVGVVRSEVRLMWVGGGR